ncbi:hypothetical protein [Streptomyces sp. SID2119]|uniref:hypothetical protein n=1 Tax=Streptomyces sp. SID2119 TaxID=2690253 RepID=UPI0013680B83|nr:hypothetical protein [Streptomyces sp. SID2119]MYW28313.1 hypothetical protein [Streptomyces sp. SID2119]
MPTSDGYGQGVQYPVLSDAPNIELAFQTAVHSLASRSVMRFANANERSAVLKGQFAPVPGMVTYLIAEDRYYARMKDGSWQPLTPEPWKPLTLKSGFVAESGSPGYRVMNGLVHLRGRIARTGNGRFTTGTEWTIANLPAAVRPSTWSYWVTPVEIGASIYFSQTKFEASTGDITVVVPPGQTSTTNGLHWTGLDGCSYSL